MSHQKGKEGERDLTNGEVVLHAFAAADGEVSNIHNVAETYEVGVANSESYEGQLEACERLLHEDSRPNHVKLGGPVSNDGTSICTPPQHKQISGPIWQMNNGGHGSNCKVYTRKRWFQKKNVMGQPSIAKETTMHSINSQSQLDPHPLNHDQNVIPKRNYDTEQQSSSHQGTQELEDLSSFQEAVEVWNRAKVLGVIAIEDMQLAIPRLKDMDRRDKQEADRLGNSSGSP